MMTSHNNDDDDDGDISRYLWPVVFSL